MTTTGRHNLTCCERNFPTVPHFEEFRCPECGKDYRLSARHSGASLVRVWEYVEADHQQDVTALREEAVRLDDDGLPHRALDMRAAAGLLETHIMTGINLRTFGEVGEFVDHQLALIGRGPVTDNGA